MRDPSSRLLGVGALLVASQAALGAQWSLAPTLNTGGDYDSNRYLYSTPQPSGGAFASLALRLAHTSERLDLSLSPQFDYQQFTDRTLGRAWDLAVAGAANWTDERWTLAMSTRWTDQSLLSSERFDTGYVDLATRRLGTASTIAWSTRTSERYTATLTGYFENADFHGGAAVPLQNYRYATVGLSEGLAVNERLEVDVSASVGDFMNPAVSQSTRSYSLEVGLRLKPSERVKLAADVGANRRTFAGSSVQAVVGDISLSYATARGSVSLSGQRTTSPSGYGVLTERDTLQIQAVRALSERLSLSSAVDVYRLSSALGPFTIDDRTYEDASVSLNWRTSEHWTVSGQVLGARATSRRGSQVGSQVGQQRLFGDATGAQFRVTAAWVPNPRSISR